MNTAESPYHASQWAFDHTLIMAAGLGSRMMPLSGKLPKPMAPFLGTTLIGHRIDALRMHTLQLYVTVGHLGDVLAQHVIGMQVHGIFNTMDRPSGWWIGNTLLSQIDTPVLVTTSDNLFDLDLRKLREDYEAAGQPACMIVPVDSPTAAGDRLALKGRNVSAIGPQVSGNLLACGVQVLRPAYICQLAPNLAEFHDIWAALIRVSELKVSNLKPRAWAAVDTLAQLQALQVDACHLAAPDLPSTIDSQL